MYAFWGLTSYIYEEHFTLLAIFPVPFIFFLKTEGDEKRKHVSEENSQDKETQIFLNTFFWGGLLLCVVWLYLNSTNTSL